MSSGVTVEERAVSSDPEAQLALGLELLDGATSLEAVNEATALIESVSNAGHAPATERCALIECLGIGRPVDWAKGLNRIELAAEQGSERAQRQLLVLAGADEKSGEPVWDSSGLRADIDVVSLLGPRKGMTATEKPLVEVFPGFATAAECRWLIEATRERLGPSTVYDYSSGALRPDSRRTSRAAMFTFDDVDLVVEMVRARISATLGLPLRNFEVSQVLHYAPGQEFKPHHDYFDPAAEAFREEIAKRGQRVATLLIYLNEDFEGGKTQFPSLGFSYRGQTGDAIAFASVDEDGRPDPLSLHAGLPPTSGEKWIFSQWIRDRVSGA
jgi:hypothetical protein